VAELQRRTPERNERESILIATEDEKSARLYFESLKLALRAHRVLVIADHVGSDPNSVVQTAIDTRDMRKKESDRGLDDPFDQVWVVFDTEGPQNAQRQVAARHAINRAHQLKFFTAVSNPSFEYWLLLHFEWCVDQFVDGKAVSHKLKKYIPAYNKKMNAYNLTWPLVSTATDHAARVFRERCQGKNAHPCLCHPCTEIYKLIESLLSNR